MRQMSSPTKLGVFFSSFSVPTEFQLELVAGLPPGRYDSKWRFGLGGASSNSQWWENVKNMRENPWQNMTKQPKMVEKRQKPASCFFPGKSVWMKSSKHISETLEIFGRERTVATALEPEPGIYILVCHVLFFGGPVCDASGAGMAKNPNFGNGWKSAVRVQMPHNPYDHYYHL